MKSFWFVLLFVWGMLPLHAADITGVIRDVANQPLVGVNVAVRPLQEDRVVASAHSQTDGSFVVKGLAVGSYTLICTHVGYAEYRAELQVDKDENISLGTLMMQLKGVQLGEAAVVLRRNVFTADKQTIYPSQLQVESSGGGLDLLQKLPIPLLEVNPFHRTISSLDSSGGVAILINDIPADANEVATLNPKQVRRVEVVRKPGLKYGDNLAMALNIVLKQARNGVMLGMNTTNSATLKSGNNNLFATYTRGSSQWSLNQSENYQNYSRQTSEDLRQYLMPNGDWHKVGIERLSSRMLSATHGTTLKYNLTRPYDFVLQLQGYLTLQHNPKQERSFRVRETGKSDYTYQTHHRDEYHSPALNLYFKKYLPKEQMLVLNAVGTYIGSDYDYRYAQAGSNVPASYSVEGRKSSFIGELKYSKGFAWGSLTSGVRSFYEHTQNSYTGSIVSEGKMVNVNSNAYVQLDGQWKQWSGSATLALEDLYYDQQNDHYHKQRLSPQGKLNYALTPKLTLGYNFRLASRLPELSSMNDMTYQIDQWERRVGNSQLKPFNHIEHSLTATYYTPKWYAMLYGVYVYNKNGIMPTLYRTEVDGRVFFDNGARNERDMKQWVATAYLRYVAFQNKLVLSGTGTYNYYYVDGEHYTNRRGFFFGNLRVESYLGKFYLSANVRSRYNALFAESVWYNEYASSLNVMYKWKAYQLGVTWEQPFQRDTNSRVETFNPVVRKMMRQHNPEAGNHVLLTFSWRWEHGFKSKAEDADMNNKDTNAGILK